jgi:HEPN domain-containing protein
MKPSTKDWLKAANDDLLTIENLLEIEELTHIIAFHAQQAIEKTFKAVFEEFHIPLIRTHNLETLSIKVKSVIIIDINEKIIAELDRIYLDARYPGEFGMMPFGKPTKDEADIYYKEAKRLRKNIENLLST